MKTSLLMVLFSVLLIENVNARNFREGHFIMTLTDKEANPITNATVYVKTLNRTGLAAGAYDSHYTTFSAQTDSHGVADVAFQFLTSHFDWWLDTPSHHSGEIGFQSDSLSPTIVRSDYWNPDTNTVEGLVRYNELKALGEAGDYEAYARKFEHKNITYASNTVYKSLSFYPKRNPQPMHAYGRMNSIVLPGPGLRTETNGCVFISCPTVSVDLKKCSLLPPFGDGEVEDFSLERYCVETNNVQDFYGRMVFRSGCGVYRANKTSDESFPSTYQADVLHSYDPVLNFRVVRDLSTGHVISSQRLLENDEYLVSRTRLSVSAENVTNGWYYSKMIGPIRIRGDLSFTQVVFNPRLNDTNLEFDVRENLSGTRGESRWP